jgi:3-phenylpropionate/cinnamic acid dioxygenase small subunit
MDDGEQIRALIHAYAERIDGGDLDGLAALFAHSTWRSDGRSEVFRGVEQVRRMYRGVILYDGRPCTKHVITNVSIVSDGSDVATARSYFTVLQATPELPLQPIIAGSYHDEFTRVDGTWRFSDRLIIVDLVGDLSRHMRMGDGMPQRS